MESDKYYMAFIAVRSLKRLLRASYDWPVSFPREIADSAYREVLYLQEIAIRVYKKRDVRLVWNIEDAASGLRKAFEHLSRLSKSHGDRIQISMDTNLKEEVDSFSKKVKTMKAKMKEYDADSSRIGSGGGQKSKMVGFSDQCRELAELVQIGHPSDSVAICGMAGIGKTTLARKIFDDRLSLGYDCECSAWVTVGRNPQFKEIVRSILDQVNPDIDETLMERDEDRSEYVKDSLWGRRCLIVLDDVWDEWVKTKMKIFLVGSRSRTKVLLTTRLENIARQSDYIKFPQIIKMHLMDKEESWNLLREKVFGEEPCPSQLEKDGKKIAEHCDGLPLTIVTVADLLSKVEKTTHWSELAAKKNHPLFLAAYAEISKVLLPSYENLPQISQMCFLDMGVFPPNYKIPRSKLINLWCTDGFLEQNVDKFSNAMKILNELISESLVMMYQSTTQKWPKLYREEIKTCGLHSSFWYLSNKEAGKIKFCHVLNSPNDGLGEGIEKQCRLSFHNNVLFGMKDVYKSVEHNCASTASSLLFYGPYHHYQVPFCFALKLLKQLDALTIRFYEFPMEILQLVQLRYLAFVVNGKLPTSISQLSNLQVLIVGRHMSIKHFGAPSYLPVEIWNMNELQHLQVMGCDLPDPPCGASLESLSTLLNVSPLSCTKRIFEAIPNLEKLGIRIELVPDGDGKCLSFFDDIFHLHRIITLKCVIENPKVSPPLAPLTIFSSCLEKLSLSGLGYSWEELNKLSSLPYLRALKLQNYAFRGPKWEVEERGFSTLVSLLIEDTDLVEWKIRDESFLVLRYLSIKHCYKLEKIHGKIGLLIDKIELVDCNHLGVKQINDNLTWKLEMHVNSSWIDGN